MIRIDLLPAYVARRRLVGRFSIVFVLLFVLITGGLLSYNYFILVPTAEQKEDQATQAEAERKKIDGLKAQAAQIQSGIAPIQTKLDFIKAVQDYNRSWVTLYDTLARYTDPRVVYSSAAVSGTNLSVAAYSPSIEEAGLFLEEIYKEPDFSSVNIDHLPGYPDAIINKYYLNGKLIAVGSLAGIDTGRPGVPGQFGPNGPGGYGGPGGGQRPPGYGSGPVPGGFGPGSGGTGGFGQVIDPLAATETPNGSIDQMVQAVVSPLATGQQATRLSALVRARLLRQVVVKHQVRGFDVGVTATLKNAFSPPAIPAATGAPTGAPSGGAPGGF